MQSSLPSSGYEAMRLMEDPGEIRIRSWLTPTVPNLLDDRLMRLGLNAVSLISRQEIASKRKAKPSQFNVEGKIHGQIFNCTDRHYSWLECRSQ